MPSKRLPKSDKREIQAALTKVFCTPEGQEVLLYMCDSAGITTLKDAATAEDLLMEKGAQRMVHGIISLINMDPRVLVERIEHNQTTTYSND